MDGGSPSFYIPSDILDGLSLVRIVLEVGKQSGCWLQRQVGLRTVPCINQHGLGLGGVIESGQGPKVPTSPNQSRRSWVPLCRSPPRAGGGRGLGGRLSCRTVQTSAARRPIEPCLGHDPASSSRGNNELRTPCAIGALLLEIRLSVTVQHIGVGQGYTGCAEVDLNGVD